MVFDGEILSIRAKRRGIIRGYTSAARAGISAPCTRNICQKPLLALFAVLKSKHNTWFTSHYPVAEHISIMAVELKVPEVGESITEVQIAQWRKRVGERAEKDENLVEIESDKATVELPAPIAGTITQILKQPGEKAQVGEVIGYIDGAAVSGANKSSAPSAPEAKTATRTDTAEPHIMPAAERVLVQQGIRPEAVTPTGPGGRMLKEDVQRVVEKRAQAAPPVTASKPATEIVATDFTRQPTAIHAKKSSS
jgi:pyruvate/2-oxoglutarate dehydrogenase complex dihydrolipoamide acyltransferase (E2) component